MLEATLLKHRPLQVLSTNQISDLLANPTGWVYAADRGWYKDDFTWSVKYPLKFTADFLSRISAVEVEFTGYYDSPSECIGANDVTVTYSQNSKTMGTVDAWDYGPTGQDIFRGDLGNLSKQLLNVVGQTFRVETPLNQTITKIELRSSGWSENGRNYAFSRRGMRNFKFYYR